MALFTHQPLTRFPQWSLRGMGSHIQVIAETEGICAWLMREYLHTMSHIDNFDHCLSLISFQCRRYNWFKLVTNSTKTGVFQISMKLLQKSNLTILMCVIVTVVSASMTYMASTPDAKKVCVSLHRERHMNSRLPLDSHDVL